MKKIINIGIAFCFVIFFYNCSNRDVELIKQGDKLITKIEAYKKRTGNLPSSLQELGIKETEEGPFYYQKKDSVNFIVWFGTSLGESKTYYSDSKKWEAHQR